MFVEGVHCVWSCVVRYRELRSDERLNDNLPPKVYSGCLSVEKDFSFEEKVLRLPPQQGVAEGAALGQDSKGINGGGARREPPFVVRPAKLRRSC
jgi:hypothetical protein